MLSKTPRRAAIVQACINQPDKQASPLPHEVWIWLGDKLAEDLSAKFLHLARIPESSAGIYSARMRSVLYEWMFYAMWATRRSEDHLPDLLPDVKYKAMALRRHLEDVRRLHLEAAVLDPRASWYDNGVLEHLPLSVVDSALEALATLIGALNRVTSGRRGRSRGTKGNLEKSLLLPIADSLGVNVSESERERSGIIRRQFCGVRSVGAIFRGALNLSGAGQPC